MILKLMFNDHPYFNTVIPANSVSKTELTMY